MAWLYKPAARGGIYLNQRYLENLVDLFEENGVEYCEDEDGESYGENKEDKEDREQRPPGTILVMIEPQTLVEYYSSSFSMEYWYEECKHLTFESVMIPFKLDKKTETKSKAINLCSESKLIDQVGEAMEKFGGRAFVRLNSLSPKYRLPVTSGRQALDILLTTDRTMEEIKNLDKYNLPSYIVLREFHDLTDYREFRLFIYDGKLTAVSQNFESDDRQVYLRRKEILNNIQVWFDKHLKKILPYLYCIADIAYPWTDDEVIAVSSSGSPSSLPTSPPFSSPSSSPLSLSLTSSSSSSPPLSHLSSSPPSSLALSSSSLLPSSSSSSFSSSSSYSSSTPLSSSLPVYSFSSSSTVLFSSSSTSSSSASPSPSAVERKIWLIEFNDFGEHGKASALLFDWVTDAGELCGEVAKMMSKDVEESRLRSRAVIRVMKPIDL